MYQRKTYDTWIVQGKYELGWEEVFECATWGEAKRMLECYNENERLYPHRIKKVRKPIK